MLKISSREVVVSDHDEEISTFETMQPYKICSESDKQIHFEYTMAEECGRDSTRAGYLNKVLGNLRLSRSDRGQLFVGEYQCKPAERIPEKEARQ